MIDKQIFNKSDCMGCYACETVCPQSCINMHDDNEGFWYPEVDYNQCVKCGQCVSVCPLINKSSVNNEPVAYACMNNDEEIRLDSSSGGIFTIIAQNLIDVGGIVFGAAFNEKFEVEHKSVENHLGLGQLRGSKYLQSRINDSYWQVKDQLISGRKVLFTGTPCQVAGLKSYLGKPFDNLITMDLICHGVPSPSVWRKYVKYREQVAGSTAQRIAFRRKNEGWKRYSVSFIFNNDTEYRQTLQNDLYMRAFLKDLCLRPSCYDCGFKTLHRQSDITLADFWGVENVVPEMDDDLGTSLIWINSEKGKETLSQINSKCKIKEVDINQAIQYNPAAMRSASLNHNRELFFKDLDNTPFDKLVRKYCTDKINKRLLNALRKHMVIVLDLLGAKDKIKSVLKHYKLTLPKK